MIKATVGLVDRHDFCDDNSNYSRTDSFTSMHLHTGYLTACIISSIVLIDPVLYKKP